MTSISHLFIEKCICTFLDQWPSKTRVTVTGGEPFLHPNIDRILFTLRSSKWIQPTLSTNGERILQEPQYFDELEKFMGNLEILCSLDGPHRRHSYLRNDSSSHQKTIEFITQLQSMKYPPTIRLNTILGRDHRDWLSGFLEEIDELHLDSIRLINPETYNITYPDLWNKAVQPLDKTDLHNLASDLLTYEKRFETPVHFLELGDGSANAPDVFADIMPPNIVKIQTRIDQRSKYNTFMSQMGGT